MGKDNTKKIGRQAPVLQALTPPPSLRDQAYDSLKKAILNNVLKPGVTYNASTLAAQLGLSKTPVQEAILRLASLDFIKVLPRRGVQVNVLTDDDIHNLYEFRLAMETAMVRRAAQKINRAGLEAIEKHHARAVAIARDDDPIGYLKADRGFHGVIASLSDNGFMQRALENVRDLIDWMGIKALSRPERVQEVNEEHQKIIDGLKKGDVEVAVVRMAEHIELTERNVLAGLKNRSEDEE